jgi:hypothetical protein
VEGALLSLVSGLEGIFIDMNRLVLIVNQGAVNETFLQTFKTSY